MNEDINHGNIDDKTEKLVNFLIKHILNPKFKYMRTLLFLVLFALFGCNEDVVNEKNISVNGFIIDNITKMPIVGARVTLVCWYHAGWDKSDYLSIDTLTDKNGRFSAKFEKGYKLIAASVAEKYNPNLKEFEKVSSNVEISLNLTKSIDTTHGNKINLRYYIIDNTSN